MLIKIFLFCAIALNLICFSACTSLKNDVDFMPFEQKDGYSYTADRNVKTATGGFIVSGGMNNVRLSDANNGM